MKRQKKSKKFFIIQEMIFLNQKKMIIIVRIVDAFSSNYIEYKSNGDKDKTLTIKYYLDQFKPYLRGAAHRIGNLRQKAPKEIPLIFQNGSTYDYHFIIKE